METKNCIEPTNEQFKQLVALDYKGPVWLVNLLKFKRMAAENPISNMGKGCRGHLKVSAVKSFCWEQA